MTCDGLDNDCDHSFDESDEVVTAPNCALQLGVCSGKKQYCSSGLWQACGATQYGSGYQSSETICDALDNDCDGSINENMVNMGSLNTLQNGVCVNSKKSCNSGVTAWFDDYSGITGYILSEDAKITTTQCDGLDNDCDGIKDEPKMILSTDVSGDGDINCNGCMENIEFTTYKNAWKQATKENAQFTEVKNAWKTLVGC